MEKFVIECYSVSRLERLRNHIAFQRVVVLNQCVGDRRSPIRTQELVASGKHVEAAVVQVGISQGHPKIEPNEAVLVDEGEILMHLDLSVPLRLLCHEIADQDPIIQHELIDLVAEDSLDGVVHLSAFFRILVENGYVVTEVAKVLVGFVSIPNRLIEELVELFDLAGGQELPSHIAELVEKSLLFPVLEDF